MEIPLFQNILIVQFVITRRVNSQKESTQEKFSKLKDREICLLNGTKKHNAKLIELPTVTSNVYHNTREELH